MQARAGGCPVQRPTARWRRGASGAPLVALAACGVLLVTGCRHPEPRPAFEDAAGAPAWRVLYGSGRARKGTVRAPECRVGVDGQQVCGHHCRTGRDGRVACAATPDGTCEVRPDGRAACVEPPPSAPALP
ncbi:MAG: hypothetical protein RL653_2149 [Pseudomonadota bacterium]|jgi:hypothetical protein